MKCIKLFLVLACVAALCAGCAGGVMVRTPVVPPVGGILTMYKAPLTTNVEAAPVGLKKGVAWTLYVREPFITNASVAWKDASLEAAAKQGGISRIYYADYELFQVLGVFAQFTTIVYGE